MPGTLRKKRTPSRDPTKREGELTNLAFKLAEKQLKDGTATSQVITHFLKLATTREQLENDRLRADLELSRAKVKHLESQATSSELYEKAIEAFRTYAGYQPEYDEDV